MNTTQTTRAEHLAWCKKRALEYVDTGDLAVALASMVSDMNKHPETANHIAIGLGMQMMIDGMLNSPQGLTKLMIAYHGKQEIKDKYLARVSAHRKADELIKGSYWENGKGCAVGCTVHSSNHRDYETELGIPRALAKIEDGIFEGLVNGKAKKWPEQFLEAIKPGVDLRPVVDKFLHWLLVDPKDGVVRFAKTDQQREAINRVGELYANRIAGTAVSLKDWEAARKAAYDAAAYAAAYADAYAVDAAAAACAYAVDAAAYAYAYADAYAVDAAAAACAYADAYAADAVDAVDAKSKARLRQAEKLIELLKAA